MKKLPTYHKRGIFECMRAVSAVCPPDQTNFNLFTLRLLANRFKDDVLMFDCMEHFLQDSAIFSQSGEHYFLRYFDVPEGLQINMQYFPKYGARVNLRVALIRGMYCEDYGL